MDVKELYEKTKGYKSKVAIIALVALSGSYAMGYIDEETLRLLSLVAEAMLGYGIYDKLQRNMKK